MVSSLAPLGSVVGQVLLRLADGALEITIARLVEADEEDEPSPSCRYKARYCCPAKRVRSSRKSVPLTALESGKGNRGPKSSSRSIACLTFARCLGGRRVKKSSTGVRPCGVS
jgi:hypothetical protein